METKREKNIIKRLKAIKIDKADTFFYVGLFMLGCGVFARTPWLAFCVVGSILVIVSIIGAFRK